MNKELLEVKSYVKDRKPLIHCITNPISIHDCANMILAVGARPVMAEHPSESAEITASAQALMLNLGNITDARIESMVRSMKKAREKRIPVLVDLVGISSSSLRRRFSGRLLTAGKAAIIKGNISEMLTAAGLPSHSSGVDAGEQDALTEENLPMLGKVFANLARSYGAVILVTGKTDLVTDGKNLWLIENGTEKLSEITGTGCMAGALAAAFLSANQPAQAAVLACLVLGIAGEQAQAKAKGPGSFQAELLDAVYALQDQDLEAYGRIREVKIDG